MPPKSVTVYPCACPEGHYLTGVSTSEQEVDFDTGARLVATGAFTFQPDGQHAPPDGADEQPEGPADAGPSDIEE